MEIPLKPIGIVHTKASDNDVRNSVEGVEGVIEIFPEYAKGLDGIEEFSHIIVIAFLHKVSEEQRKVLKIRHRKWARLGVKIDDIPEIGVFCSDSPHRPNPIALSIVELVERNGRFLKVKGLDLFDGTPILDIRAYTPDRCIKDAKVPKWYITLVERIKKKFGNKVRYV
mgnify:CR=1 FL=1